MALLNDEQIEMARARAQEVLNGFATVKEQNARDARNLADTLQLRNRQIAALEEKINDMEQNQGGPGGGYANYADVFRGIFGQRQS